MKRIWIHAWIVLSALAIQSHAIFGVGGHWAPALGFDVKANQDTVASSGGQAATLDEKGLSGLQGFGAKIWIDALPFVDLQMTGNFQFGYYDVDLITPDGQGGTTTTPVSFGLKMPFVQDKPYFARAYGDLAVLYPFLKLPPLISLVKVYGGGGVTYGVATQILTASFAKSALASANLQNSPTDQAALSKALIKAMRDRGLKTGMGGFLQLGSQFKPPVIPIAVYLDFKYHFLGFAPDLTSGSDLTMELGGALAF